MTLDQFRMETKTPLKIITHDQFCMERVPKSCGIVIFGASGDLAHRKLIPALYKLFLSGLFPKGFFIVGYARTNWNDETFRNSIEKSICEKVSNKTMTGKFLQHFYYHAGSYTEAESLKALRVRLESLCQKYETNENVIFYLATPPVIYSEILAAFATAGLISSVKTDLAKRVVFEKPFGTDLSSAKALNISLAKYLHENQIYRIDHYLAKETVQNIMIFRFMNSIFEPVWNRRYIDHVQITVAETLGLENRAGYYDQAGALRDMFQNHMLQLLSLVAMEPPVNFDAQEYRDEKVKVLRNIRPILKSKIRNFAVRGQYQKGMVDGKLVPGYREENGILKNSSTETFVALKLFVDNWRWQEVPFYLRTGKRLKSRTTEIAVQFKKVPHSMFAKMGIDDFPANVLLLQIQPKEGISISFEAKHPGPKFCMATLNMQFNYQEVFGEKSPEAYERLLLDVMLGDQTLFVRQDMVEESWELLTPILDVWKEVPVSAFPNYEAGSEGPEESFQLLKQDGRRWRQL